MIVGADNDCVRVSMRASASVVDSNCPIKRYLRELLEVEEGGLMPKRITACRHRHTGQIDIEHVRGLNFVLRKYISNAHTLDDSLAILVYSSEARLNPFCVESLNVATR